jgi:DNA-directed RNA polymerase subunit RPC12/RpoP
MRNFLKEGCHDWDIIHEYHRCDKCGQILENRERWQRRLAQIELDLECHRCGHHFTLTKNLPATLGPLMGGR